MIKPVIEASYSDEEKEILDGNKQIRLYKDRIEPFWGILTTEQKGIVFDAIVRFGFMHEKPDIEDTLARAAFDNIFNGMASDNMAYIQTSKNNRVNGSKNKGKKKKPQEATGSHTDPVEPNTTHKEATTTHNNPLGSSGLNEEPSKNDWDFTGIFGKPQEARETESNPQETYTDTEKEKDKETGTDTGTGTDRVVVEDLHDSEDIRLADRTAVTRVLRSMCDEYRVPYGKRNRLAALVEEKYNEGLPITRKQIEFTVKNIDAFLS